MNCSILVKNILIQVIPNTFSIFMIDAFDTLTEKYFLIRKLRGITEELWKL